MISLLIFFLLLGVLIVVHEFGHFIAAKKLGVKVETFALGFGPRLFSKSRKGTHYDIRAIPLGGYVKLSGDNLEEFKHQPDDYLSQPIFKRFWIIFSGPMLNLVMGFLCFWVICFVGYPSLSAKVGSVLDDYGAKEAGIQVGDEVIKVDGKKIGYWEDLQKAVFNRKDKRQVVVSVLRDNKELNFTVLMKERSITDSMGQKRNLGLLGVAPKDEVITVKHGFFGSFVAGIEKSYNLVVITYEALWYMVTGKLSLKESVTGPLGMFYITSKAASLGIVAFLHLIAVLNINLAIFNLLPLPALDGCHIFLLGLEKVRGRYLSHKSEQVLTQVGFGMIILLAVAVFYNDLIRFGIFDKVGKFFSS